MSFSMNSSTAGPALTISITLRGAARLADQFFQRVAADEVLALGSAGQQFVDLARGAVKDGDAKAAALDVQARFSPITARPISPMSQFGVMAVISFQLSVVSYSWAAVPAAAKRSYANSCSYSSTSHGGWLGR